METLKKNQSPFFEKDVFFSRNSTTMRRAATASGTKRKTKLIEADNTEQEWSVGPGSYNVRPLLGTARIESGFETSPKFSFSHKFCDKQLLVPRKLGEGVPSVHSPGVGKYTPKPETVYKRPPSVATTRQKRELYNFSSFYHIVHAPIQHLLESPKDRTKGGVIGTARRFQEPKACPGPGDYIIRGNAFQLFSRERQSFSRSKPRHPLSGVDRSQGPAAYSPIEKSSAKKGSSFCRSARLFNPKPTPGPCEYSVLDTGKYKYSGSQLLTFKKESREIRYNKMINYARSFIAHPSSRRHFFNIK